jgi:hypothetical protein
MKRDSNDNARCSARYEGFAPFPPFPELPAWRSSEADPLAIGLAGEFGWSRKFANDFDRPERPGGGWVQGSRMNDA